ncbi:MAG: hypothetical protein O7J95_20755 [Planctomycetota bacterium]|nr:hypothetical protein [Planctomycetota bacterium]
MAIVGRARRGESRRELGVAVVGTGFMGPVDVEAPPRLGVDVEGD